MLSVEDVSFSYGRVRPRPVFSELSWKVTPGVTTLLLGPNGAGKSTLLKLLAGQERPTSGSIRCGDLSGRTALFEHVAWMPQDVRAARGLTVLEQVHYAAWVAGHSDGRARERASQALELVRLDERAAQRTSELSGGQLRRLGLAQAWARGGDVLLLDEPTAGLDPAQTLNFRAVLPRLEVPGGVVISTHQVADVDGEFDRVAVLHQGRIVFDGDVEQFRAHGASLGVTTGGVAETFSRMIQGGDA